jgi:LPXTG-motif cell wall-anchored protein
MRTARGLICVFAASAVVALSAGGVAGASTSNTRTPGAPPHKAVQNGQVVTDLTGPLTPEDLAAALAGEGVTVSNVTYTGDDRGGGTVNGFADPFGLDTGVALSSGAIATADDGSYVSNLIGPNAVDDITTDFGLPGDPDLDELVAPNQTQDATVLEFDFVATGPDISFRYMFGSDEYLEYVGSEFNDVFAFYVDGVNCATVPDPEGGPDPVPVTVNTINKDANPELFVSNSLEDDPPAPHNTELDGFTTILPCAAHVSVGETHHLKLAIADTSDRSLDSTVIIQAGSLQINEPPVADDQDVLTTLDTPVDVTLTGSDPNGDPITFEVATEPEHGTLSGTAPDLTYTPDAGYVGPDSFTFTTNDGALTSEPGTVTLTVQSSTPTPTGTLPGTGSSTATPWMAGGGALALLVGAALVIFARRRLVR